MENTITKKVDSGAQRILNAAKTLFSSKGYEGTSVSAIAKLANISKANIYHHYSSKEDLYLAVLQTAYAEYIDLPNTLADTHDLTQCVQQFVHTHMQTLFGNEQNARLLLQEIVMGNPQRGEHLAREVFWDSRQRFIAAIEHAQQAGQIRSDIEPGLAVMLLLAPNIFSFMAKHVLPHFPNNEYRQDPQIFSEQMTDLLMHGLLPRQQRDEAVALAKN